MASYATVAQFRDYLGQLDAAVTDSKLQDILDRATSIIDEVLGFSFAAYGAASTKYVRATYGPYLLLPPHQVGSVTVISLNGSAVASTYWTETDTGTLYAVDSSGYEGDWRAYRYLITAVWGYGPAPAAIVEICLEVATNIWRSKDAGRFTNVIGVDGSGAVGYEGALTPQQKLVIEKIRERYREQAV
jgi:hypothetical protein